MTAIQGRKTRHHRTLPAGLAAASVVLASFTIAVTPLASAAGAATVPTSHPMPSAHHARSAHHASAIVGPRLAMPRVTAPFRTFVVNTTADSPLLNPNSVTCVDDQLSARCSLRAAIQAANNLNRPVLILLTASTYNLNDTSDGTLSVTNTGGTTISGKSTTTTRIVSQLGSGHSVFYMTTAPSGAGATLQVNNLTITGASGVDGGGFYLSGATLSLVLNGVKVNGNNALHNGGGMYCSSASVWATNSSFSSNTAATTSNAEGGGIYAYWCNLYFTNDSINSNVLGNSSYGGSGGGMYVNYGTVSLVSSTVNGNVAGNVLHGGYGGGIYDGDGTVDASNSQINHNTAYGTGGGTYESASHFRAVNTQFEFDQSIEGTSGAGGGIFVDNYAVIELTGTTFAHDTTTAGNDLGNGGGAIYDYAYEYGNQLMVTSSTFIGNNTSAVVLTGRYGGLNASFTNTLFQSNSSSTEYAGGAIFEYMYEHGGFNMSLSGDTFIHNNSSGQYGAGAVGIVAYDTAGADATVAHCSFTSNTATGSEAAGAIMQYAYNYSGSTLTITNSVINSNRATNSGWGGGVGSWSDDSYDGVQLIMDHDTVSANIAGSASAYGEGGGIFSYNYTTLTLTNSVVTNNVANGDAHSSSSSFSGVGGGVYDGSYHGSSYQNDNISGNQAVGGDSYGGGVWIYPYQGGAIMQNSTVTNNRAIYGAGIYMYDYTMLIKSSTISGNVAGTTGFAGQGGGIYVEGVALQLTNSTVTGNVAVNGGGQFGQGGGLYIYSSYKAPTTFYFDTVVGNAATKGAGIYLPKYGYGSTRDSIIAGNTTVLKGKVAADCYSYATAFTLQSAGGNLLGRASCVSALNTGDVTGAAGTFPLASNGGPTKTLALSSKSLAVGLAKGECLAVDQRGVARKAGHCDSGAYQLVVNGKAV